MTDQSRSVFTFRWFSWLRLTVIFLICSVPMFLLFDFSSSLVKTSTFLTLMSAETPCSYSPYLDQYVSFHDTYLRKYSLWRDGGFVDVPLLEDIRPKGTQVACASGSPIAIVLNGTPTLWGISLVTGDCVPFQNLPAVPHKISISLDGWLAAITFCGEPYLLLCSIEGQTLQREYWIDLRNQTALPPNVSYDRLKQISSEGLSSTPYPCAIFNPDGTSLAVLSSDFRTLLLWDVKNRSVLHDAKLPQSGRFESIHCSPDGKHLAIVGTDAMIYELQSLLPRSHWNLKGNVTASAFGDNGDYLLTGHSAPPLMGQNPLFGGDAGWLKAWSLDGDQIAAASVEKYNILSIDVVSSTRFVIRERKQITLLETADGAIASHPQSAPRK